MNVCTIIAKNYLAHARVLAHSLERHDPEARLWVLIIDELDNYVDPAREPFEVLTPAEIGCHQFTQMATRYSILELSTAVKPWLLRHLMGQTGQPVTYLDPDIKVFGSVRSLDELAARHGVALTPHNIVPIPADGRRPTQVDIMIAGVFNLGYVTLSPRAEVDSLLDWWADRLLRDCRVDPIWGYFVDQRWFDLAPGLLSDLAIVRDPQYNVAYWNLHSRRLERRDGQYLVDGRPLAFFHFSGFDPDHPLVLSRHQDRIDVAAHPALEAILAEYAAEVLAEGHAISRRWPYSYGALGDGTVLDPMLRSLYDQFTDEQERRGRPVLSPFALEGIMVFDEWIKEQAPGAAPGVNRALAHVYSKRSDLRAAYPDKGGSSSAALIAWAHDYGRREVPLLARAMSQTDEPGALTTVTVSHDDAELFLDEPAEPLRDGPWGVNVVAPFGEEREDAGLGRGVVAALDDARVPTVPVDSRPNYGAIPEVTYAAGSPDDAPFPVNVLCLGGDGLREFIRQSGRQLFAGRYSIGLWSWPVTRLPDQWRGALLALEELWAPSPHAALALEALASVPVTTVRVPVAVPAFTPGSRRELGLPDGRPLLLCSFEYDIGWQRHNPFGAIAAFRAIAAERPDVELILRCGNAAGAPDAHALVLEAAAQPGITVIDHPLSHAEEHALIAHCDCLVSLHHAESFGVRMAQAMWQGKPVIATGYSGNLDFMTPDNSLLVNHTVVPVGAGVGPYPADAEWAEPDVEHAAALIKQILDDPPAARELGARAARTIRRTHSPAVAGEIMARRLESIRATGRARRAVDEALDLSPTVAELPLEMHKANSRRAAPGRHQGARQALRQVVLRAMRPVTIAQRRINTGLIEAVMELNRTIAELRRDDAAKRAALLAQLRRYERLVAMAGTGGAFTGSPQEPDPSFYLALAELARRHAEIGPEPPAEQPPPGDLALARYELRVFSAHGEDGAIAEALRRIGAPGRCFAEVGIRSARQGNCVYLAEIAGWRGLFVAGDQALAGELGSRYQGVAAGAASPAAPDAVSRMLADADLPDDLDVLSIDAGGEDYWVWEALESPRPRVVVIAYNAALDPHRQLVQPREPDGLSRHGEPQGASLGALQALGERKGYRLVHTDLTGASALFVLDDLAGSSFCESREVALRAVEQPATGIGGRYLDLSEGCLVYVSG